MNQLLYTVNPHTLEVVNLETGERHQADSLESMIKLRGRLELESRSAAVTTTKKAKRLALQEEARQGGR